MGADRHNVDLSPHVSDEIRQTTCYMCACRCGINVHLRTGEDGQPEGPLHRRQPRSSDQQGRAVRQGLGRHHAALFAGAAAKSRCCAPASAARANSRKSNGTKRCRSPPNGSAKCACAIPKKLAFFTGRDQSQSLTGWWAQQFGTPNFAAHGGFCSVNMAAGGIYTFGGAFWEFGAPDWDRTELFMIFGVAEDHDSNPIKMGLGKLKARGVKVVGVNPVRTGYNAIADEWVGITPGTDGLFILSLVHELLRVGKVDLDYLLRYTNAPWLVIEDEGAADHGLVARNEAGDPLIYDRQSQELRVLQGQPASSPPLQGSSSTCPTAARRVPSLNCWRGNI